MTGSLLEAFGILPSHAREWLRNDRREQKKRWHGWQRLNARYGATLRWSLHNRYFMAVAATGLLAVAVVFAATRIPFLLFGHVAVGQFFVNVETPNTYSIEDSSALATRMEEIVLDTLDESELDSLLTNVGVSFIDFSGCVSAASIFSSSWT